MSKKEIEAYRANFEYGRKCWEEFVKEHPVDKPFPDRPERKIYGQDPFKNPPKPEPKPESKPEPRPLVAPSPALVKYEEERESSLVGFAGMALAICALVLFALLLG